MTDFPAVNQLPLLVSTYSMLSAAEAVARQGAILCASITWVANQAVYVPMFIPWPYPVNRVWWGNGSVASGNVDFGIYSATGARIFSTGSTVQSGATSLQFATPATPFVLPAGRYYFAWVSDSTTNHGFGNTVATAAQGALGGLLSQATALPLPATATFATYVTPGFPLCGITRTAVGSVY